LFSPLRPSDPCAARPGPSRPSNPAASVGATVLALSILGGLRACATARPRFRFGLTRAPHESPTSGGYRRTRVRRRGRVLSKPPRLKGFRPATAPTEAARGHPGRVRRHGLRLSSGASSRNRAFSSSSRRLVRGTSRDTSSARLRLLVSRACRIRDDEPSASKALLQASAPSKPPHQPLRRVFLRYLFAARLCLALARRVTAAKRGARFERANPSDRAKGNRREAGRAIRARQPERPRGRADSRTR